MMIGLWTNSSSVHTWYRANNGLALWRSPIRAGQRVFLDEGYKWSPVQPTCGILKRGGKLNKYSQEKFAKQIVQNQNKLKQDLFHNKEKFAQKKLEEEEDAKAKTLRTRPFHNGRSSWRWVGRACRRGRWLARPTTPPPTSSHHHSTATRPPTPGHSSSPITILTISNITRQPFFDCQQWTPNTSTDSSSYLIQ